MKTSKDVDADSVVMVFLASKPGVENDAVIGKPGTVRVPKLEWKSRTMPLSASTSYGSCMVLSTLLPWASS